MLLPLFRSSPIFPRGSSCKNFLLRHQMVTWNNIYSSQVSVLFMSFSTAGLTTMTAHFAGFIIRSRAGTAFA